MEIEELPCSRCKETKATGEFYKNRTTRTGFDWWCIACVKKARNRPHDRAVIKRLAKQRYRARLNECTECGTLTSLTPLCPPCRKSARLAREAQERETARLERERARAERAEEKKKQAEADRIKRALEAEARRPEMLAKRKEALRRAAEEKYPAAPGHKVCRRCLEEKPHKDFYQSKHSDGYSPRCRQCKADQQKLILQDPEKHEAHLARMKAYRKRQKEQGES